MGLSNPYSNDIGREANCVCKVGRFSELLLLLILYYNFKNGKNKNDY